MKMLTEEQVAALTEETPAVFSESGWFLPEEGDVFYEAQWSNGDPAEAVFISIRDAKCFLRQEPSMNCVKIKVTKVEEDGFECRQVGFVHEDDEED